MIIEMTNLLEAEAFQKAGNELVSIKGGVTKTYVFKVEGEIKGGEDVSNTEDKDVQEEEKASEPKRRGRPRGKE